MLRIQQRMYSSTLRLSGGLCCFVFINFSVCLFCDGFVLIGFLLCSAAASSMAALKQPTIKVVAIIAEGVPESDTKQLIAYARANNKVCVCGLMSSFHFVNWSCESDVGFVCRLLLDRLLLEVFKLVPLRLVTLLGQLITLSSASFTDLDLLVLSPNLYVLI